MLNPETTAFIFPGQGSQFVGMGRELAETSARARALFEEADGILGVDLSKLCWEGPESELNDTVNTQPALFVCSLAALRSLQEAIGAYSPACAAGHSLGEITALVAAEALGFEDGLELVRERGRLMKLAGEREPGGMAAILNLDLVRVAEACATAVDATGQQVQVANFNCPGQVVISGHEAALEQAMAHAREAGARRVVRLPVSIAAHSTLMQSVADEYQAAVDSKPFVAPRWTVIANASVEPLVDSNAIRAELGAQLTSPVRWTETIQKMRSQGVTDFVELGAKNVLTTLLRWIDREANGHAVDTSQAIEQLANTST